MLANRKVSSIDQMIIDLGGGRPLTSEKISLKGSDEKVRFFKHEKIYLFIFIVVFLLIAVSSFSSRRNSPDENKLLKQQLDQIQRNNSLYTSL